MRWVSSAAQVRALDAAAIEQLGIPGFALMELAAAGAAAHIRARYLDQALRGTVVVCGGGNNGGDGYAIARWLRGWGWPVSIVSLTEHSSGDAGTNRALCEALGIPISGSLAGLQSAALVVDAVLGTGLTRAVEGRWADALLAMRSAPAPVVAVDIPSGLQADTGRCMGPVPPACSTVTFGRLKPGLLAGRGAELCGAVEVVDIGLGAVDPERLRVVAGIPDATDLGPLWPRRAPSDHKSRSGHLLVVAGSPEMAGAAILTCRGALRAGVGLVTLAVDARAISRLGGLPAEVMVQPWSAELSLARFTAVAAGPGLGGGRALTPEMKAWLGERWAGSLPAVFDADALPCTRGAAGEAKVATPHAGEAGRLLGIQAAAVEADRFAAVRALATGHVALLKGRNTLVAPGTEGPLSVNPTGGPTLATAGSGDVLTGVIGALLARGLSAFDAARLGAWVHGRAGESLARQRPVGWTASDIAAHVAHAAAELMTCA